VLGRCSSSSCAECTPPCCVCRLGPRPATNRRDIVYLGKIDPGEQVAVLLLAALESAGALSYWCRLVW